MTRDDTRRAGRVEAEAKLNLFLRIAGREPSGYHQLSTLFQRIALADAVMVRTGGTERSLDLLGPHQFPATENIAWHAAEAFAAAAGWPSGFAIEIEKRIPIGGGLGGGSADAAAVLRILNALAPTPLDAATLFAIAFRLGADVPYLLSELALSLGTGRGERLREMAPLPARELALWIPPFGVASRDAFGWYAASQAAASQPAAKPAGASATQDSAHPPLRSALSWAEVADLAGNDLEPAVFTHHPELAVLLGQMDATRPIIARMSGSGSTLFAVYGGETPSSLPAGCRVVTTKTVERVASVDVIG